MPYQQQMLDPFRKVASQLRASAGFMLDGISIPSTTAPRRRAEPGTVIGRKIFDLKAQAVARTPRQAMIHELFCGGNLKQT